MGIKESIANLRKALRTTQTNAPAVIDTLIRGLDGVETAAEEENTYSTDERIVGTWTDGNTVYEKTFEIPALPNNTTLNIDHNISIDKIVSIDAYATDNTNYLPIPFIFNDMESIINITAGKVRIVIFSNRNASTYKGIVTLRYTKTAASRSPENDTKNDGDEEKNTDER